jgi:hypothetical protein
MSRADDNYDPQLDGNNDNLLALSACDAAEDFVYQSLNNNEGGDAEQYNIPDDFNGTAMNEPEESMDGEGLLCPLANIWDCPFIVKCTAVGNDGHSYAGCKCGFCLRKPDGSEANPFRSQNATKVLCHVAKIKATISGHAVALFPLGRHSSTECYINQKRQIRTNSSRTGKRLRQILATSRIGCSTHWRLHQGWGGMQHCE